MLQGSVVRTYIESEIAQSHSSLPANSKAMLVQTSLDFFEGRLSFDQAKQVFSTLNCEPIILNKLHQINNISSVPLPNLPQDFSHSNSTNRTRKRCFPWTEAEDLRLIAAIIRFGARDWKQIAEFVGGGRNSSQCNQRWCRALDPTINHTPWTPEEDEQLQRAVKVLGRTSWCQVAKIVTGRTDLQCRYRYFQLSRLSPEKEPSDPPKEPKPTPAEPKILEAPSPEVKIQRRNSITIAQFEMPEIHPGHKPFKQIPYFLHSDTLQPRCDNGAFLHRLPPRIVIRGQTQAPQK